MNREDIEDQADEALEDIETSEVSDDNAKTLEESIRRIELSNLYLAIVKTDVFSAASGSPESVAQANREFKQFAVERINALLGISTPKREEKAVVSSPFDDGEVLALKALAAKVLRRDMSTLASEIKRPVIQTVGAEAANGPAPEVRSVPAPKPILNNTTPTAKTAPAPATKKAKGAKPASDGSKMNIAPGSKTAKGNVRTATGYATPANYAPNLGAQPVQAPLQAVPIGNAADLKIPMNDLIQHAIGGQQSVTTLSDTIEGGDPNERI